MQILKKTTASCVFSVHECVCVCVFFSAVLRRGGSAPTITDVEQKSPVLLLCLVPPLTIILNFFCFVG